MTASLVADVESRPVGHCTLSPVTISDEPGTGALGSARVAHENQHIDRPLLAFLQDRFIGPSPVLRCLRPAQIGRKLHWYCLGTVRLLERALSLEK